MKSKNSSRKKIERVALSLTLLTFVVTFCLHIENIDSNSLSIIEKPTLHAEPEEQFDSLKNRRWSCDETFEQLQIISDKIESLSDANISRSRGGEFTIGTNGVAGSWKYRGPENVSGAWNIATIEIGTDTVYATTCGHYGGGQTIWKGTLAGDNFKMLSGSGRMPMRYRDINVVRKNGTKVILATSENGPLYTSTDDGTSWTSPTGLPSVMMSTVVDRKTMTIYTTNGKNIYVSTDLGSTFSNIKSLASKELTRLHTPMFSVQPGYGTIYMQHGQDFYKLVNGTLTPMGSITSQAIEEGNFNLNGDARRLYLTSFNSNYGGDETRKVSWWTSTDEGNTWIQKYPTAHYYDQECEMSTIYGFGVSPLTPEIVIGGYAHPCASPDALNTVYENYEEWGFHQGGADIPAQEVKNRNYFHNDFQSTHIWLDKSGNEFSLWCSDGGILYSETVHKGPQMKKSNTNKLWRNLTMLGTSGVAETYILGMTAGTKGPIDFCLGTQDQGIQRSEYSYGMVGDMVKQYTIVGGDGDACSSGPDGLYGWLTKGDGLGKPFSMYQGDTFIGSQNRGRKEFDIAVKGLWFDLKDYHNTIWVLNDDLHKVTYNGGFSKATKSLNNTGYVAAMCQSPVDMDIYWVLDNNKVYKSTDGGTSFGNAVTVPMSASTGEFSVRGWAFDNNTILFAGKGQNGVHSILSTDGGQSFREVSGFPGFSVIWMQGDKNSTVAMASTRKGPYLFDVQAEKWYDAVGPQETGSPFFDGQWGAYIPLTNSFRFSTWGYGVWDFVLDDGTPSITVSPLKGLYKVADTLALKWDSRNCSGDATISLLKDDTPLTDLGQVDVTSGEFTWVVPEEQTTGSGFRIQIRNGSITKKTAQFTILPNLKLLAQNHIHVVSSDSEEGSETADKVLDGDLNTKWHTEWSSKQPDFPHEIVFAVDTTVQLGALTYQPRKDGSENGRVKGYKIYMSSDESNWIEVASGELQNSGSESFVAFDTIMAMEYLKFEALSEVNGNYFASASEINLYYREHKSVNLQLSDNVSKKVGLQMNGKNRLTVTLSSNDSYALQILSVNGRIIHTQNGVGSAIVDLSRIGIAQGVYMVRLHSTGGIVTKKITMK